LERNASRAPLASLMMLAVTPAPAALILSRMAVRLVSSGPMVMSTGVPPVLAVKPSGPVQLPSVIVSVPSPSVAALLANAVLETVCPTARLPTLTA